MTPNEIILHRLVNQQIAESKFSKPDEIVSWMVAMQAQEYAMAKWAIGLRGPDLQDKDVDSAFNDGAILRTHLLRPTWHFVTPRDIRWLLVLTAPQIKVISAYMFRKLELDSKVFNRTNDILAKALEGGRHLTRTILNLSLKRSKIIADGLRLGYIMMYAEIDGIICSGARQGKQFTYALLDERAPLAKGTPRFSREEALAELTQRYFTSRGPATVQDFAGWSGLSVTDARSGLASVGSQFTSEVTSGREYIFSPAIPKRMRRTTFLMADYDEYGMSYKDRSAIYDPKNSTLEMRGGNPIFNHVIVIDGVFGGSWQQTVKGSKVEIKTAPYKALSKNQDDALHKATNRYLSFFENE